jgi:hypothetical protein
VWAGRSRELADWRDVLRPRRLAGEYERGRAILGEPGIGKSVLAARLSAEARDAGDLVVPTVRVPRGTQALSLLADALTEAVHHEGLGEALAARALGLLDRVRSISAGVKVDVAAPEPPANPHLHVTRLLVELGRLAREDGRAVTVHVDEIQNVTDAAVLSQLLIALGDALRHTDPLPDVAGNHHDKVLPLLVHVTGLPDFADRATSTAGATFARRFQPVLLTALPDADVRLALAPFTGVGWPILGEDGPEAVVMTAEAVDAITAACLGDPFLLQLAGKAAWDAGSGLVIRADEVRSGWFAVHREARAHVERAVERLPRLERALVDTLAQLDPDARTLSRAAELLGRRPADLATTARRLEGRGIVERGRPYVFTARTVEAFLLDRWP